MLVGGCPPWAVNRPNRPVFTLKHLKSYMLDPLNYMLDPLCYMLEGLCYMLESH